MKTFDEQTNRYREVNDKLSSILQHYEDLRPPNIVVVGEQSAGKSSVLEYLSGIQFVTGEGMVTRCPLQLRMTRSSNGPPSKATIKSKYFQAEEILSPEQGEGAKRLEETIREITLIHLKESGGSVSNEMIEVEIVSPHVPDLTLMDLPGLIQISPEDEPNLKEAIKNLVTANMTERDCILIVGDAARDLQTIVGFEEARKVDPTQKRTLCALTKVDRCVNDENIKLKIEKSVANQGAIRLTHGFIALKNRLADERSKTIQECEQGELTILNCFKIAEAYKGRSALIEKLTTIQNNHLRESIPKQKENLKSELKKVSAEIESFAKTVSNYLLKGEEALIEIFEECSRNLKNDFDSFSVNSNTLVENISSPEELMKSLRSETLPTLSTFTKLVSALGESIICHGNIDNTEFDYFNLVVDFIGKQSSYPGLPDLYQPTIILELVKLKLKNIKEQVEPNFESLIESVNNITLNTIIPNSLKKLNCEQSEKLVELLKETVKSQLEKNVTMLTREFNKMFKRESHRTYTMNPVYTEHSSNLRKYHLYLKKDIFSKSTEEKKSFERSMSQVDINFVASLHNKSCGDILKDSAAIEILFKLKAYLNVVANRLVDQMGLILYDNLIVETKEHLQEWIKVTRVRSLHQFSDLDIGVDEDREETGIPMHLIVDILLPSAENLNKYHDLKNKRGDIGKALKIIESL